MSEQTRDKGLAELDLQESAGSPGPLHPKDRVRVTFESNYEDVAIAMWHNTPLLKIATLELLERADDPAKDELGTLRLEKHDDDPGHSVWLCTQDRHGKRGWFCVYSTAIGNQGGRLEDDEVAGLPVAGALPGTPAAEAEKPASSSHESHCKDLAEAIYASHIYPWEELLFTARRYATHAIRDEQAAAREEFPEVSGAGVPYPPTESKPASDLCTLDDCVAGPRCSSGATVWHDRTPQCGPQQATPRVFRSDGPEPPQDVRVLEWLDSSDKRDWLFLHRVGAGWLWAPSATDRSSDSTTPNSWSSATNVSRGRYREVLS